MTIIEHCGVTGLERQGQDWRVLTEAGPWTAPSVINAAGADVYKRQAQILLKTSRQVPAEPVWVAGSGPCLLYTSRCV